MSANMDGKSLVPVLSGRASSVRDDKTRPRLTASSGKWARLRAFGKTTVVERLEPKAHFPVIPIHVYVPVEPKSPEPNDVEVLAVHGVLASGAQKWMEVNRRYMPIGECEDDRVVADVIGRLDTNAVGDVHFTRRVMRTGLMRLCSMQNAVHFSTMSPCIARTNVSASRCSQSFNITAPLCTPPQLGQHALDHDEHEDAFALATLHMKVQRIVIIAVEKEHEAEVRVRA